MKKNIIKIKKKDLESTIKQLISEQVENLRKSSKTKNNINESEETHENIAIKVYLSDFPDYNESIPRGTQPYTDTTEVEHDVTMDGEEFTVTFEVRIKGEKYSYRGSSEEPEDVGFSLNDYGIRIINAYKFIDDEEVAVSDEENSKLINYIGKNIEITE